ncbi:oxysterol-binding protein-related protein 8 [Tetranychus urticae]|uniref:PH domain-containing protein n=1 Tax=Tetranychus urticae TaxID=32264 RepID=T1JT55_TETUR|nr:oxysterol-binding protein-related protein 8 [Tetranychus urticae]
MASNGGTGNGAPASTSSSTSHETTLSPSPPQPAVDNKDHYINLNPTSSHYSHSSSHSHTHQSLKTTMSTSSISSNNAGDPLSPTTPTSTTCNLGYEAIPVGTVKRDSYKDSKRLYQKQKKKAVEELLSILNDPTVLVMADWLKVRGTLKSWTKLYCELKPGLLVLYKNAKTHKSGYWVGTILLNMCEIIERPSKKDGFCFKLFNPLDQTIWAPRGPRGESFGAIVQPLPMSYLIFRASSEQAGLNWMKAIEVSLNCSIVLMRGGGNPRDALNSFLSNFNSSAEDCSPPSSAKLDLDESEIERHFKDHDLEDDTQTDHEENTETASQGHHSTDSDSSTVSIQDPHPSRAIKQSSGGSLVYSVNQVEDSVIETVYVEEVTEDVSTMGEECQTEEVAEENKSLLWSLLKQVRPGMDLSKVVLPTFILEPRSFLDKLSDYYYHCDILSKAALEEDPLIRMKKVVKWYLSGFYKKPKGLKKPYNPILGECFRCYWAHPETDSRTFYISEQVSHHPPISTFYVTNRKDGYCISGSILAKSKFYGNSVSAILNGTAKLTFLNRGEDYTLTMPYAHCKGILMGTLSLELGGKVDIKCEKTGYCTEMEFKLKPFLGGSELCNNVVGKIKLGKETLCTLDGHWDTLIKVKDKRTGQESILWEVTSDVRNARLKRHLVPLDSQEDFESEKMWRNVTNAIINGDQIAATEEKTILEEEQRREARERLINKESWNARNFIQDLCNGEWIYRYLDSRPWDPRTDVLQYERNFQIQTKTRHKTPTVACRTSSVVSIDNPLAVARLATHRSPKSPRDQKTESLGSEHSSASQVSTSHLENRADGNTILTGKNQIEQLVNKLDTLHDKLCSIEKQITANQIVQQMKIKQTTSSTQPSHSANNSEIIGVLGNSHQIKMIIGFLLLSIFSQIIITLAFGSSKKLK